jgi:hypothetical protein
MCIALLPKVGYARVTHSGIVILKKSRWSLFSKRIPVTDIIIKYIPIEIGKLICKSENRAVYVSMFNDKVATIVSLTKYVDKMDLFETVYAEYLKTCMIFDSNEYTIRSYQEPIVAKTQGYNINNAFKGMKNTKNKYSLSNRVKKLKNQIKEKSNFSIINLRIVAD